MGKTRPPERSKLDRRKKKLLADQKRKNRSAPSPADLLAQASILLQQSDVEPALALATKALAQLKDAITSDEDVISCLPALNLLGDICVELGDIDAAREYFGQAAQIDEDGDIPEESGGGPEKFLWLAQLSDQGGEESVQWFKKAADILRSQIHDLSQSPADSARNSLILDKKANLANSLCAIAEVYMTDLSWEDDAEEQCNSLMREALAVAPEHPETLQTAASVRISQSKIEDAQTLLRKSLNTWKDLPVDSPNIPEFAVRVSLARLLMEASMEEEAMDVIERLILEDDHSVETWYLGGWCLHLIAKKQAKTTEDSGSYSSDQLDAFKRSRQWLLQCLKLYDVVDYEDQRLQEHTNELVHSLHEILGPPDEHDDDEDENEDEDEDEAGGDVDDSQYSDGDNDNEDQIDSDEAMRE